MRRAYACGKSVCYESGAMFYKERLIRGRLVSVLRSASGQPRYQGMRENPVEARACELVGHAPVEAFELEIGGQSLHGHWEWIDFEVQQESDALHAVLTLENHVCPVRVRIHTRLRAFSFIERSLEIENLSEEALPISRISPFSGMLSQILDPEEHERDIPYELICQPDVEQLYEGFIRVLPITNERITFSSKQGRSGHGLPWFSIRASATGEVFVGYLEWSYNWRMDFEFRNHALCFAMGPEAHAPLYVLEGRSSVKSPVVHLGHLFGNTDTWVGESLDYVRALSRPVDEKNLLIGCARVVDGDMDWLRAEVDLAAEMDMEYFMIDAGWYCDGSKEWFDATGDWAIRFDGGTLERAKRYIEDRGMHFVLWMEPESAGKLSQLHQEHPKWRQCMDGIRDGRVLDLSKPEVANYVQENIARTYEEIGATGFKIDYNSSAPEGGENERCGYMENSQWRYTQTLYDIYDDIARHNPEIILEGCAAGGGRNDLGMFRRNHTVALSDYALFPRSIVAVNNVSMALPPERLRFYYGHMPSYHALGSLETQLRLLMFTNPLFVGFGRDENWLNPTEKATLKKYIHLYKEFCRPVAIGCRVYHHTPLLPIEGNAPFCALEYARPDRSRGYAGVFRLIPGTQTYLLRLHTDLGTAYRITRMSDDSVCIVDGWKLAHEGLSVPLEGALDSEMFLYERVR